MSQWDGGCDPKMFLQVKNAWNILSQNSTSPKQIGGWNSCLVLRLQLFRGHLEFRGYLGRSSHFLRHEQVYLSPLTSADSLPGYPHLVDEHLALNQTFPPVFKWAHAYAICYSDLHPLFSRYRMTLGRVKQIITLYCRGALQNPWFLKGAEGQGEGVTRYPRHLTSLQIIRCLLK